jgi:hypothetical protein
MSAVIKRYGGKPHLKLTLLILADRASDDGYCWPSYDELAGKLGCSRRSAINNVNALIEADLLQIVAKGGRFTDPQTKKHRGFSNRFVINVAAIEALPLVYQPRGSSPQGAVDGCSALQDMGEVGLHPCKHGNSEAHFTRYIRQDIKFNRHRRNACGEPHPVPR